MTIQEGADPMTTPASVSPQAETNPPIACEMWVVIDLDDEDAPPLAAFQTEEECKAWIVLSGGPGCIDMEVVKASMVIDLPAAQGAVLPEAES